MNCNHKWTLVCAVHNRIAKADGRAYKCYKCGEIGFVENGNQKLVNIPFTERRNVFVIEADHAGAISSTSEQHL